MAQTKLFAPEGFHFMISKDKGFYLMKNPPTGYVKHTLKNGEMSSTYVMIDVPSNHNNVRDSFYYNNITKNKTYIPKPTKQVKTISTKKAIEPAGRVTRTVRIMAGNTNNPGSGSGSGSGGGY